jgi:hypothetical protein
MNLDEREYFVSRLRCGYWFIKQGDIALQVKTPTIEDEFLSNQLYKESFIEYRRQGIMTEDEMLEWRIDNGLWSEEKDKKIKGIEKDIENMKVEVFNNRNVEQRREQARMLVRAGERTLDKYTKERDEYYSQTCEGLASEIRQQYIFKRCCFQGDKLYEFADNANIDNWFILWAKEILKSPQIRELARTDPWRSVWAMKDHSKLFLNEGRELSVDQKNIIIWSQMYDNVQESMESPTDDVVEDDDMLDGWFIVQRRKHEHEKAKSEIEDRISNDKISSSDEIYVMADSRKEADNINNLNSTHGKIIKKQREAVVRAKGEAQDLDFKDRQLDVRAQSNAMFKGTIR